MKNMIEDFLKMKNWIVVGASPNRMKFGNTIYRKLKDNGYNVVPVNPVYEEVEGVKTFSSVLDVKENIDCINIVVSPKRAMQVVKDALEIGVKNIWFQPDTFNEEIINFAKSHGINVIFHACVLVEMDKKV